MRRLNLTSSFIISILGCFGLFPVTAQGQTIVRMETSLGDVDIELYDTAAPITVANFLNYVNSSRYDGTLIHRSVPGFVIQGGGIYWNSTVPYYVVTDPPIVNEFDPARSNVRGTIAMAKSVGPDTATSQWFFNLVNNDATGSINLDDPNNNGGYTVFGRVMGNGMDVVDAIAALQILPIINGFSLRCPSPLDVMPLLFGAPPRCPVSTGDLGDLQYLMLVNTVRVFPYKAVIVDYVGNTVSLNAVFSPATLANIAVSNSPSPIDSPNGIDFSEGFFSLQIGNLASGSSTVVTMQLPTGYLPNTYYMYGPTSDNLTPHWYEFNYDGQTGAEFSGNNVALHFVDGARGDADLTENGQISDLGAPGINNNAPVPFNRGDVGSLGWAWLLMLGLPLLISRHNTG